MIFGWQSGPALLRTDLLRTGSLRMVTILPAMLQAEQAARHDQLQRMLLARVTAEWPPEDWQPHVYDFILQQYADHPQTLGWHRYVVLHEGWRQRTLVGAVGAFPRAGGDVEIGYSTLPQYQRRGYATACARTLVDYLLQQPGVQSVSACTFPRLPESIKVMERCGMSYVGEGDEPGSVRFQRLR